MIIIIIRGSSINKTSKKKNYEIRTKYGMYIVYNEYISRLFKFKKKWYIHCHQIHYFEKWRFNLIF